MKKLSEQDYEKYGEEYNLSVNKIDKSILISEEIGYDLDYVLERYNDIVWCECDSYQDFINDILDMNEEKFPNWFIPGNIGYQTIFDNSDLRMQFYYLPSVGFINKDI